MILLKKRQKKRLIQSEKKSHFVCFSFITLETKLEIKGNLMMDESFQDSWGQLSNNKLHKIAIIFLSIS